VSLTHETATAAVELGRDLNAELPPLRSAGRLERLQVYIQTCNDASDPEYAVDALLVTHLPNIRYLAGFTGSAARLLVPAEGRPVLITDQRYDERATEELANSGANADVIVRRKVTEQNEAINERLRLNDVRQLALEDDKVSWAAMRTYSETFDEVFLVPMSGAVESLRRTKDVAELTRLARASAIADAALVAVVDNISGLTEAQFARLLNAKMMELGANDVSFDTIIASGPNASRPHHEPSDRVIQLGDEVICDFGALVDGYHSDMTRTVYVGPPTTEQQRHHEVVKGAHDDGIAAVRPDVEARVIDSICRSAIASVGWNDFFVHGTGHGSGLDIHEAPALGETSSDVLATGDIVTVEPGVYFPGKSGVRVEDSMVITPNGPVLLTRCRYDIHV
jgi:Xaa-Pro aminopeptidase